MTEEELEVIREFDKIFTNPPEKREQKVLHDEQTQVVHRDNEALEHDKAKVYTEKPLIEEEEPPPVILTETKEQAARHISRKQLLQAMKWGEILGKPKALR